MASERPLPTDAKGTMMKTKFDDNVANDIPVTKNSAEPGLPWKISESELTRIEAADEGHKSAVMLPPLHVRAVFVVLLVITICIFILNSIANVVVFNKEMLSDISKKDMQVSSVTSVLKKTANRAASLSDSTAKLEKRVNDLNAQKELYAAVIETLTKKTDETPAN